MKFFILNIILPLCILAVPSDLDPEEDNDDMFDLSHIFGDDVPFHMLDMIREGHANFDHKSRNLCPFVCKFDYTPVCGSDGITYDNKCELTRQACKTRKHLTVQKQGQCDS